MAASAAFPLPAIPRIRPPDEPRAHNSSFARKEPQQAAHTNYHLLRSSATPVDRLWLRQRRDPTRVSAQRGNRPKSRKKRGTKKSGHEPGDCGQRDEKRAQRDHHSLYLPRSHESVSGREPAHGDVA
ncbi:hypothetical protein CDD83_4292 [Cordyceps sp. RAO-2017]|nr:hypothetical protein CDD83_4292 [Cordyceps sp. RAO-2017]